MTVKTAISLEDSLFQRVDALAHELEISRSQLFALAADAFVKRHDSQRLLEMINAACDDLPDRQEQALLQRMRVQHRRLVEGQW